MAAATCEKFVDERLEAPSTADFSGVFDATIMGAETATP